MTLAVDYLYLVFIRLRKCPSFSTVLSGVVMKVLDVFLKNRVREGEREGEKHGSVRKTSISCLLHASNFVDIFLKTSFWFCCLYCFSLLYFIYFHSVLFPSLCLHGFNLLFFFYFVKIEEE